MANVSKYNKTTCIRILPIYAKIGAKVVSSFWDLGAFSADCSGRARKVLNNCALIAKIGVDTAEFRFFLRLSSRC